MPGPRGGAPLTVDSDEGLGKLDPAKLRSLKPYFKPQGGTVTAGNASPITDGAAALVLTSGLKAKELGLQPLAVVRGYADASQAPEWFTTTPALAVQKVRTAQSMLEHFVFGMLHLSLPIKDVEGSVNKMKCLRRGGSGACCDSAVATTSRLCSHTCDAGGFQSSDMVTAARCRRSPGRACPLATSTCGR